MIEINFNDLNNSTLINNNNDSLKIIKDDLDFYIKINIKKENDKVVVFSNGAVNKKIKQPPIFQRSSWHSEINASCIFIDDRTLHNNNLALGWGIGTPERHYIKDYSDIIKKITSLLKVDSNKIFYYGSSAGGYMSMVLASLHRRTRAIANNPQVYVSKYKESHVNNLYETIFPGMLKEDILKNYGSRFSLINNFSKNAYVPYTYYLQNLSPENDITYHFNLLHKNMIKYKLKKENITFITYYDDKRGHNPISKEHTITIINNILETAILRLSSK